MKKVALIILDGFGISPEKEGNALLLAKVPYFRDLVGKHPKALLKASAQEVGLPWGEVGNSEVGHTNIGLGRVVLQDLPQIDKAIAEHKIDQKKAIEEAKNIAATQKGNIHLIGIASDGAVHGHIKHLIALKKIFASSPIGGKIIFHLIADGRDVPEKSFQRYLDLLKPELNDAVIIGSVSGRYYAMDRDKNWDRIEKAFQAIACQGPKANSAEEALKSAYERKETDEFMTPTTINGGVINLEKDVFILTNYRADRSIQISRVFIDPNQKEVSRPTTARYFCTMTTYSEDLKAKVLFSPIELNNPRSNPLTNPLPKIIADNNLTQCHLAETEKFAHVTYFFSGGVREPFKGQENKLIESKKVKSYDLYPQMRAQEITKELISLSKKDCNFIIANYANPDMVGHSGNLEATIEAVQITDCCLKESITALTSGGYTIFLTADHGNIDEMVDLKNKRPNKEHTLNPVPFVYINSDNQGKYLDFESMVSSQPIGVLADIAPMVLAEMGLRQPVEMTGMDLRNSLS